MFHLSKTSTKFKFLIPLLCLLALGILVPAKAQASDLGHKEQVFTTDDGLPTTSTLSIEQTADGFIWMGGYGGLTRYDGNEFRTFGGSRVSNVSSLLATDDHALWISSLDSGLIRYFNNEFTFFNDTDAEKLPSNITTLDLSADGNIYFAAENGLGYVDSSDQIVWIEDENIAGKEIVDLACGSNGEILCITANNEMFSCQNGVERLNFRLENDNFRCVDYDKENDLFYIGSEKNSVIICDSSLNTINKLMVKGVYSINAFGFYDDNQVYVCSDDGVAVLKDTEVTVQQLKIKNSVEDVLIDMDGNIWIASSRQGVLLVTKGRFRDISLIAGLDPYIVNTILYENGRLYIGHDNGYVILDETTYQTIEDENYAILKDLRIRDMELDSKGRMWVCTTGSGLFMRDSSGKNWTQYTSGNNPDIRSDKFRCVVETSLGIIAATDEGAYIINGDKVSELSEDLRTRVLSIVEANGCIYAGTDGNGLYVIKDGEIQKHITMEDGLSSMRVMKMQQCTGKRGLWLATGNNLDYLLFETGEISHAETFPTTNVMDCLVMEDSSLWILAGNGIYQTTETAILSDESTRNFRHYSKKNGIPYDLTANSYSIIVDDHAYLCGAEGVTWMNINPNYGVTDQYTMIIDTITMDENSCYVQGQEEIQVGADINRLEINAHLATYTQENPTIFYYLENFDDTQHFVSFEKLTPIIYTNVPGGDYTFHFGVYNPDNTSLGQEITMDLKVAYKWYEKTAVKVLLILLFGGILLFICWSYFYMRSKKEQRLINEEFQEKEKSILQEMAYTDYLTGLYNRNYLGQFSTTDYDISAFPVNFVALDCNNLKLINDKSGHDKGDELLQTFANMMKKYFSGDNNTILRLGGDEFLIISEGTSRTAVTDSLEEMSFECGKIYFDDIPLSFCYGIATCDKAQNYSMAKLTQEADEDMIRSKQAFHSQVYAEERCEEVYDGQSNTVIARHMKNDILSNILYEAFQEASDNVYIYVMDVNTGLTRFSENCVEFFGLPAEYMTEAEAIWRSHVHPEDVEIYANDILKVFSGESTKHSCQYRMRNKYDEYVWVECKGSMIKGSNGRYVFAGMVTRLDNQSMYDPLTGLKTKNQFYEVLHQYDKGSVLMMSIDDFREVTSVYGYENGDRILVQVGKKLIAYNNDDHPVFRLNGAEFVFILPDGNAENVENLFNSITNDLRIIVLENGLKLNLSYTGGAAPFTKTIDSADDIVNRMEQTLEYAKINHRGSHCYYDQSIMEDFNRSTLLKKELKASIENNFMGFDLYYQPLIKKSNGKLVGCESLLRWNGETIRDALPTEFIPILEETGWIIDVGRRTMQEAMRQQKIWAQKFGRFLMTINVSYQQFLIEGYVDELVETAKHYEVDPSCIIIELTESCKVQSPDILADIFTSLRAQGFNIVLDDFGTGYASLEMLKKLPSDGVKIEHNFVRDLGSKGNATDLAIINSIISLCNELGQHVIVEGIENKTVARIVSKMQVSYLQGHFYSEPIGRDDFEKYITEH